MSSTSKKPADVASSISKLSLDPSMKRTNFAASTSIPKPKPKPKPKAKVADSWEDEDVSSSSENGEKGYDEEAAAALSPPPPTPRSPASDSSARFASFPSTSTSSYRGSDDGSPARRPEKTDAVARRMIAGALGLKAPRLTEEQRAYDRSLKEKERKRKEEERATEKKRQEEIELAKKAIWED